MDKEKLLNLVDSLELPKTEYYILSSGSLLLYGLREIAGDLDLCVSNELFEQLKKKYNLKESDKNECGFYHISKDIEIVPESKENFKMVYKDGYPVESLKTILSFKEKRNAPKDQKDIENIKKYLKDKNKELVNIFSIENFNIIQDDKNYYFFRALNIADNNDLENGIITDESVNYTKIRTDRQRWEETKGNPEPKYTKNISLSLEQIFDHIKSRHNLDTNCISLSSNANISVAYGKELYKDKYVMVKVPKVEMGDKVVVAGQYMLSEIEKQIQKVIESFDEIKNAEILMKIEKIRNAQTLNEINEVLFSSQNLNTANEINYIGTKVKNIKASPLRIMFSDYKSLSPKQTLAKNKIFATLNILEKNKLIKPILPSTVTNSRLMDTVGRAFSSYELIHYGEISGKNIVEVQKEVMDMFCLLQNAKEKNSEYADIISEIENEIVTNIYNGYKIVNEKIKTKSLVEMLKVITKNNPKYKEVMEKL